MKILTTLLSVLISANMALAVLPPNKTVEEITALWPGITSNEIHAPDTVFLYKKETGKQVSYSSGYTNRDLVYYLIYHKAGNMRLTVYGANGDPNTMYQYAYHQGTNYKNPTAKYLPIPPILIFQARPGMIPSDTPKEVYPLRTAASSAIPNYDVTSIPLDYITGRPSWLPKATFNFASDRKLWLTAFSTVEDGSPINYICYYSGGDASRKPFPHSYNKQQVEGNGHGQSYEYTYYWLKGTGTNFGSPVTYTKESISASSENVDQMLYDARLTKEFYVDEGWYLIQVLPQVADGVFNAKLGFRAANQNGVTWTAINLPVTGTIGQTITFTAALNNSGTKQWAGSHAARIRRDNNTSSIIQQPSLGTTAEGASKTVSYTVTLPTTAGKYTYYFQAAEGTEEFGTVQTRTIEVYPSVKAEVSIDSPARAVGATTYFTGNTVSVNGNFIASGGNLIKTRLQIYNPQSVLVWSKEYTVSTATHKPTISSSVLTDVGTYTLKGAGAVSLDGGTTVKWTEATPRSFSLEQGVQNSTVNSETWPATGKDLWFKKSEVSSKTYQVQKNN